jgi:hypothetical protein
VSTFGSWPTFDGRRVVLEGDPGLRASLQVEVDFGVRHGPAEDTTATTTVYAPVAAGMLLTCSVTGTPTADHGPHDAAVEQLSAYTCNIVPGVSFDVIASAPNGTWGRYLINITG